MKREKSILYLEEWEKVKARQIYNFTKNRKGYEDFNLRMERLLKHRTGYKASFRIATKHNYTHKDLHPAIHFKKMVQHNAREKDFKTDLTKSVNLDLSKAEHQNQSKTYIKNLNFDSIDEFRNKIKSQRQEIYKQLKNLRRQLQRAENKEPRLKKTHKIQELKNKIQDLESKLQNLKSIKPPRKDAKPIQEVVINVNPTTEIQDIERALIAINKEIPILSKAKPIRIDIHRDEGYINHITGQIEKNLHAHIIFKNIDTQTGKTIFRQLTKKNLQDIKKILAKELNLQNAKIWEKDAKAQGLHNNDKHKTKWQLRQEAQKDIKYIKDNLLSIEMQMRTEQYELANQELEKSQREAEKAKELERARAKKIENLEKEILKKEQIIQNNIINAQKTTLNSEKTFFNTNPLLNTQNQFKDDLNAKNQKSIQNAQNIVFNKQTPAQEPKPAPNTQKDQDSNITTKYADDPQIATLNEREKDLKYFKDSNFDKDCFAEFGEYLLKIINKDKTLTESELEYYKDKHKKFTEQNQVNSKTIIMRDFVMWDEPNKIKNKRESRIAELEKAEALQLEKAKNAQTPQIQAQKQSSQQNIIQPTNAQQQGISSNKLTISQPKIAPAQPKTKPKPQDKSHGFSR